VAIAADVGRITSTNILCCLIGAAQAVGTFALMRLQGIRNLETRFGRYSGSIRQPFMGDRDYAHTDDACTGESDSNASRVESQGQARIIHAVFGCGGAKEDQSGPLCGSHRPDERT